MGVFQHCGEKETGHSHYAILCDNPRLCKLTAYTRAGTVFTGTEDARQLVGLAVTSDIFRVLGVQPVLGRAYTREEDNVDARVVVFTDRAWKSLFNRDPNIIGRQVNFSGRLWTVIGIMPPGFQFPVEGERAEYVMPLHPLVPEEVKRRDSHFLRLVGRLKPGVSIEQCNAELNAIASRLAKQYPKSNTNRSNLVVGLHKDIVGDVRPALITILAAVLFVLLIACAMLPISCSSSTGRRTGDAIRTALRASRCGLFLNFSKLSASYAGAVGGC